MKPEDIAIKSRNASADLARADTGAKNAALLAMADRLWKREDDLLAANEKDMTQAEESGVERTLLQRLRFGAGKIESRIRSLETIARLPDPIGEAFESHRCENGLDMARVRVPLGVILMIYEARPHVTVNAGAFCLKSGNASILRGGSEARTCNTLLGELWRESLIEADLPPESIQVVSGTHEEIGQLLTLNEQIDLVIPRGGEGLIRSVSKQSTIPVIKHFQGICHVYLDKGSDLTTGLNIAVDSKCLMPEVCNAMETLLVHESLGAEIPGIVKAFRNSGVTVKGCSAVRTVAPGVDEATEEDWATEYLDTTVSIRVVESVEEAIRHINTYGSHHTDSIVTDSESRARQFLRDVDSGVVLVNASTMFCDGATLGMGAEIGISTDKLHARGPMGLQDLTTYKFVIRGEGQIMGPPCCTQQTE